MGYLDHYEQQPDGIWKNTRKSQETERLNLPNTLTSTPHPYKNNIYFNNMPSENKNSHETRQLRDKHGTTSGANWGDFARKFDEVVRGAGGRVDKRDVAETIGLRATEDTFRKLLARRKEEGKVRPYRGSPYLIEWINRDYTVTQLSDPNLVAFLGLQLPLGIHRLAQIPQRAVIGIAGFTSAGKTGYLLETAELNLSQLLVIYYWYNEMSESKLASRCEDFPKLFEAQKVGKFIPVKQSGFEFADVLVPDAINLVDYLDRDNDVFLIGQDIKQLYGRLDTGVIIFALQMKHGSTFGYGGLPSAKLANLYVSLDVKEEHPDHMTGVAKIVKCKDWVDKNPVGLKCEYYTGGQHGRLFKNSEWKR